MQTECPHRRFYRLDAIRDELSPQAAERFDSLALFDQLRLEGATEATALKAAGCSRATPCRWKRHLREQGGGAASPCSRCRPNAAAASSAPTRPALRVPPVLRRRAERQAGRIRVPLQRLPAASGARANGAPMQAHNENFNQGALAA